MYPTTNNPPIVVKTSKQWVLPPRPKPGRKSTTRELAAAASVPIKRKDRSSSTASTPATSVSSPSPTSSESAQVPAPAPLASISASMPPSKIIDSLKSNIASIDRENVALKSNLLALINDYRQLKQMVLAGDFAEAMSPALKESPTDYTSPEAHDNGRSSLKRSFGEVSEMSELINDINELSYGTPGTSSAPSPVKAEEDAFSQYIMLESRSYLDESDDDSSDIHNDMASPSSRLSRTISPTSDFDLTSSLTRTTTSTSIGADTPKPRGFATRKFFELPKFEEETPAAYAFKFDAMMATPHPDDEYHMVNDFLEEKLHDNDLKYYVDHDQILDKW